MEFVSRMSEVVMFPEQNMASSPGISGQLLTEFPNNFRYLVDGNVGMDLSQGCCEKFGPGKSARLTPFQK